MASPTPLHGEEQDRVLTHRGTFPHREEHQAAQRVVGWGQSLKAALSMRRKKLVGIYAIKCTVNGKLYVGSSRDIAMRWNSHLVDLIQGTHHNSDLQDDFHRFGYTAFTFSILRSVPSLAKLRLIEQEEIDRIDRRLLYNKIRAKKK